VRELLATTSDALQDGRGCSECSCGKPSGSAPCEVSVLGYASADCTGGSVGTKLTSKEWILATTWPMTAKSVFATLSGPTCERTGGEPIGDAVPTEGAVTLCCMP